MESPFREPACSTGPYNYWGLSQAVWIEHLNDIPSQTKSSPTHNCLSSLEWRTVSSVCEECDQSGRQPLDQSFAPGRSDIIGWYLLPSPFSRCVSLKTKERHFNFIFCGWELYFRSLGSGVRKIHLSFFEKENEVANAKIQFLVHINQLAKPQNDMFSQSKHRLTYLSISIILK